MGAEPWYYFTPYQKDVDKALQELRQKEFLARRYYPVIESLEFPTAENPPLCGATHSSIQEAIDDAGETGTRSILDIQNVAMELEPCKAAPLSIEEQVECFGTDRPTHTLLIDEERIWEIFDLLGRGEAIYCFVYKDNEPEEILFAGYSFD
jgi:hypothetical protein